MYQDPIWEPVHFPDAYFPSSCWDYNGTHMESQLRTLAAGLLHRAHILPFLSQETFLPVWVNAIKSETWTAVRAEPFSFPADGLGSQFF